MKKKISILLAGTAVGILAVVGSAGPASTAHCRDAANTSPGFSYFRHRHVQEKDRGCPGAAPL